MSGSPRNGKRPRPSYEEGKVRDPKIEEMVKRHGTDRHTVFELIKRATLRLK